MPRLVQQSIVLPARAQELYAMYLNPKTHAAITGHKVEIGSRPGARFRAFDGVLNGRILQTVPADELARAKNYVALRFPSGFESTGDISRRLEETAVYRLPDDYFTRYIQNIQAVTAADVQRVARKYVMPDKVAVVVVGLLIALGVSNQHLAIAKQHETDQKKIAMVRTQDAEHAPAAPISPFPTGSPR